MCVVKWKTNSIEIFWDQRWELLWKISRLRRMRMTPDLQRTHEVHTLPSLAVIVSISSVVSRKSKDRAESRRTELFLPYLGSGFFSSGSILTHCSAPGCWSERRQDSYHGNVEEKNINNSAWLQQLHRERPSQTKLKHSAFQANGEGSRPMREQSPANWQLPQPIRVRLSGTKPFVSLPLRWNVCSVSKDHCVSNGHNAFGKTLKKTSSPLMISKKSESAVLFILYWEFIHIVCVGGKVQPVIKSSQQWWTIKYLKLQFRAI